MILQDFLFRKGRRQGRIQGGGAHPARAPPKIGEKKKKLA
jgi:hypothetical protein